MAAALRRGIARFANGTPDVTKSLPGSVVPNPPPAPAQPFFRLGPTTFDTMPGGPVPLRPSAQWPSPEDRAAVTPSAAWTGPSPPPGDPDLAFFNPANLPSAAWARAPVTRGAPPAAAFGDFTDFLNSGSLPSPPPARFPAAPRAAAPAYPAVPAAYGAMPRDPASPFFNPANLPSAAWADRPPGPPTGIGQLLTGQFKAAQENPASSPATAALATAADYLQRSNRVGQASARPGVGEWLMNFFAGDQASTQALQARDAAGKILQNDPLIQQHMMTHPDAVRAAETDPVTYARLSQMPEYRDYMHIAQANHADVQANGVTHTDAQGTINKIPADPAAVSKVMTTHNVPAAAAHAAVAPHDYSSDEFVRVFRHVTANNFFKMFGPEIAAMADPRNAMTKEYFSHLRSGYDEAVAQRQELEAADQARIEQGQQAQNAAAIAAARRLEQQRLQNMMNKMEPIIGTTQRMFAVPQDQQQ
jgi:hypothetical protein